MSDVAKNYIYVDGYYENAKTGKRTRWVRMKLSDVRRLIVEPSGNINAFATVQRYKDATSLREFERRAQEEAKGRSPAPNGPPPSDEDFAEGQLHYSGVFFDFDCDPSRLEGSEEDRAHAALQASLVDARKLVTYVTTELKIPDPLIQCWYSGRKGFHVIVHPEAFGIQPHRHHTVMVKMASTHLKEILEMPTLDMAVYTRAGRQWRIPNSIHPKSMLFKIELTVRELLEWSPYRIMEAARSPRNETGSELPLSHLWRSSDYRDIEVNKECGVWWAQFVDLYEVRHDMDRLRPQKPISRPVDGTDEFPACMKDLMENGMKPTGPNRNKVILPMVGFLVDAGVEKAEANRMMRDWTLTHLADPPSELRNRVVNAASVVNAGYAGRLHFSCRAIRSNSGKTAEEKVACVGADNCPWIQNASDQDPAEVPSVHLSESNKGCYIGTKVRTPVHVAALAPAKYGIPLKGKVECTPGKAGAICKDCANGENGANGRMQWSLSAEDPRVLELIGVNKNEKTGAVKAHCRIPAKCHVYKITYEEQTNLEEVQLIPMVDYAQIYMDDPTAGSANEKDELIRQAKHVVQHAYHMGHGIQPNKKYMIEASVFNHPKNQKVVLLFDKAEPAQNDVDQFVMTPDRHDSLRAFQRRPGQSVHDKLQEIHQDFTANVHQIGGRIDLSIAIDLCYHSAIGFQFDGRMNFHGWWELLVVGDSGTGKFLANSERILTPTGWTTHGDVKVGDLVMGRDGRPTRVTHVFPQGTQPVYKVTFRDGASVRAGGPHRWSVANSNWERDGHAWKVKTTEELLASGLYWKPSGKKSGPQGIAKYWIPTAEPMQFQAQKEPPPMDPWLLGVLLGDGNLTQLSCVLLSNAEADLLDRVRARLVGDELVPASRVNHDGISFRINGGQTRDTLKSLGLWKARSEGKFVPPRYLWGSIEERLALLQGILDTDGHVASGTMIDYITVSPQLAKDVVFLVRSLGGTATLSEKDPTYTYQGERKQGQHAYRVAIALSRFAPVTTDKHRAVFTGEGSRYKRSIVSIEPDGEEDCTCIQVEAADKLYVADHFVVTHNSTMVNRFIQHFGLGEIVAGEEARRTGLVYASIQMGGEWIIKWGKIPQNDRRLLVIDEFSGIAKEEVEKLTQLRSEGRAKGGGVAQDHEIFARTRLIWLTNPRGGSGSLGDYNTGISAIMGLFSSVADLRRVDLAVVVEKGEVSSDTINQRWNSSTVKHIYTSDLCRSLVLWAWSREPRHIEWCEGAEERVAYWARELGEVYDCDLTLAYKGDLRLKLARIAVSVAARLFSTDAEAKKVFVDIDHVNYAAEFMDWCYRKPSMAFFDYARRYKETNTYTDERRDMIKKMLLSFDDAETLIRHLAESDYITKPVLSDTLSLEKSDMDRLWKFLNSKGLIRKNYKAWKKTPAFTEYLKELGHRTSSYRGALGEGLATGTGGSTPHKQQEADEFYAGPIPTYEEEHRDGEDPPF